MKTCCKIWICAKLVPKYAVVWYNQTVIPLGTNFSESLNIQKRDRPLAGPSLINSCPSPFPHFPHRTWNNMKHLNKDFEHFQTQRMHLSPSAVFKGLKVVYTQLITYTKCFSIVHTEYASLFLELYLICPGSLLMFGHTVLMDGLCEGRPGRRVLILRPAGEQLVVTLGTHVNPWGVMEERWRLHGVQHKEVTILMEQLVVLC